MIRDQRRGTIEVYDLARDRVEAQNLYGQAGEQNGVRLGLLKAFFDAHRLRRKGYSLPFRP